MRYELTVTSLDNLRPVFLNVGENIRRYQQIRMLFENQNAHFLFAEPLLTGIKNDQLAWFTGYSGAPKRLSDMGPSELETAISGLKAEVNHLYILALRHSRRDSHIDRIKYRQLSDSLNGFVEVPDYANVWQIATSSGLRYVLTNWGFWSENSNAEKSILSKAFPLGVAQVTLDAVFSDTRETASDEALSIVFNNETKSVVTDHKGQVFLDNVRLLSEVSISQVNQSGQTFNQQQILIDDRYEPYKIAITRPLVDLRFRVVNQHGKSLGNRPIQFTHQGKSSQHSSDPNGVIILSGVATGQTVQSQDLAGKVKADLPAHIADRTTNEYLIKVIEEEPEKPKTVITLRKAFGCLGILLLLALLIAGLFIGIRFYNGSGEEISKSEEAMLNEPRKKFIAQPMSCNGGQDGHNYVQATTQEVFAQYDLGKEDGQFVFSYYTMFAPDLIEVYNGKQADLTEKSKPFFRYYGSTANDQGIMAGLDGGPPIDVKLKTPDRFITVRVVGQTVWSYKVNCPSE